MQPGKEASCKYPLHDFDTGDLRPTRFAMGGDVNDAYGDLGHEHPGEAPCGGRHLFDYKLKDHSRGLWRGAVHVGNDHVRRGDPDNGHDSRHGYGLLGHVAFGGGADGDGGVWDRNPKLIPFGNFGHTIGFVVVSGGFFDAVGVRIWYTDIVTGQTMPGFSLTRGNPEPQKKPVLTGIF